MATLEELVVQLTAETAGLRAEMNAATKVVAGATEKMDKAVEEFSKNSSKNTSFFQQTMATMTGFLGSQAVLGTFGLLKDAAGALAGQLLEAGQEAMAEEQAFTRLATSLRLSGNYSKAAADDLADFSNEMEGLAGVGADVIASNMSVLSSLTRLDAEGLKGAQKSAIDLSAALGKDLGTTTEMIAKAINGNDMAFKKLGISMNLTSDTSKNLEVVTAALTERFGGAAQAKMNTFAGSIFLLKDSYGDMFKELSKGITQNDVVISVMKTASDIFGNFAEQLKNGGPAVRDGIGAALLDLLDIFISLAQVGDVAFRVLRGAFNGLQTAAAGLIESIIWLYAKLTGQEWPNPFEETSKQWDETKSSFSDSTALDFAAGKLTELRNAGAKAFDEMKGKPLEAAKSQESLGNSIQKVSDLSKEEMESLKSFASGLASQASAIDSQYQYATAMLAEQQAQRMALSQDDYSAQLSAQTQFFEDQQALRDAQYLLEQEALATARANNLLTEDEFLKSKNALNSQYAVENAKQQTAMTQFQAQQEKTRQENFKSTMGTIAGLASSGNKELAAIGKAAAITNATIDGYAAVQKALASAPPPFNFGLAALVGAATAANVAKIAGVGLAGGINEVPRSSRGGNGGDNFPAMLMPGERVVPTETNQDLKQFLAGEGGGSKVNVNITVMPGTGLNSEQIGNLIEQMNNYFNAGGLKLSGAQ
jgi:hypothetical protein